MEIEILPELVADRGAWNEDRQQWSGEGLAEQIRQTVGNQDAVVIGITGEDIYLRSENWQFAFSYRTDDRVAVVSYARMDRRLANADVPSPSTATMVTKDLGIMLYQLPLSDGRHESLCIKASTESLILMQWVMTSHQQDFRCVGERRGEVSLVWLS